MSLHNDIQVAHNALYNTLCKVYDNDYEKAIEQITNALHKKQLLLTENTKKVTCLEIGEDSIYAHECEYVDEKDGYMVASGYIPLAPCSQSLLSELKALYNTYNEDAQTKIEEKKRKIVQDNFPQWVEGGVPENAKLTQLIEDYEKESDVIMEQARKKRKTLQEKVSQLLYAKENRESLIDYIDTLKGNTKT